MMDEDKVLGARILCVVTAVFTGLTVWSLNGSITMIDHHQDGFGGSWDTTSTWTVSPELQGILAGFTLILFFCSVWLLLSLQADKLKP